MTSGPATGWPRRTGRATTVGRIDADRGPGALTTISGQIWRDLRRKSPPGAASGADSRDIGHAIRAFRARIQARSLCPTGNYQAYSPERAGGRKPLIGLLNLIAEFA